MKRSPLARRSVLKRKTRIKQKRGTPRRSGRVRDREYLLAVKELPCCCPDGAWVHGPPGGALKPVRIGYPHGGTVEADHAGPRPLGRKCSDSEAIPMCTAHHFQRTNYVGWFLGFTADEMRRWCDQRIAETQARVLARLGRAA